MSPSPERSRIFAVTGDPILHSRSPDLFQAAFAALDLCHSYVRLAADDADEALSLAGRLGASGLNVTAPYKEEVFARVDSADAHASKLMACNCVALTAEGSRATNTDPQGVVGAFFAAACDLSKARAVVLGAGGAARAAAYGLIQAGAQRVCLINRTASKAEHWAQQLGCNWAPLDSLATELALAGVVVSGLPGGVELIEAGWLRPEQTVLDADYAHGTLAALAAGVGCRTAAGLDWLLHQALSGFKHLTGIEAPPASMQEALTLPVGKLPSNLALVGFMGTGKTAVGRYLAERMGWAFVDLDETIVERSGRDIPALFAERGEAGFRQLESDVLAEVVRGQRQLIACGGGVVLAPANRELLAGRCTRVWLWADLELCLRRAVDGARPLLAGSDPETRAASLLAERLPVYADCSDLVIDTGVRSPQQVAERIWDEVRRSRQD